MATSPLQEMMDIRLYPGDTFTDLRAWWRHNKLLVHNCLHKYALEGESVYTTSSELPVWGRKSSSPICLTIDEAQWSA